MHNVPFAPDSVLTIARSAFGPPRPACLNNQLRASGTLGCSAWWASREGQRRGPWQSRLPVGRCQQAPGCMPQGQLLPTAVPAACRCSSGAPTSGLGAYWADCHPLLRMFFSKLGCKSQSLVFQHTQVCSLLVTLVQRTESVIIAIAGELCSPVFCRCSNLQPREEKDGACKPARASVLLCFCGPSASPVCTWTVLLLEDELKNWQCQ